MTQQSRPPLDELTLRQLRLVASEYSVSRYSRMRKDQLIEAIQEAQKLKTTTQPVAPQPVMSQELSEQETVEAAKFNVGSVTETTFALADVDESLSELPDGYGESRVVLLPRDPQWAYVYWDIPNNHKEEL
ncbi:MAG: Rho termination factor N-terminal domain-containing protein, partial [Cyanobacteria bacterium P01_A01_bin.135]